MDKKPKKFAKDHYWVGDGGNGHSGTDSDEGLLIRNRDKVEIVAEASDQDLSYEFDELAVAYLKGYGYFICQATGCSCPSPSETWCVVKRFKTKKAVIKAIEDGEYQGYTLPDYAAEQLKADLA